MKVSSIVLNAVSQSLDWKMSDLSYVRVAFDILGLSHTLLEPSSDYDYYELQVDGVDWLRFIFSKEGKFIEQY
jgi:hypothetical protein